MMRRRGPSLLGVVAVSAATTHVMKKNAQGQPQAQQAAYEQGAAAAQQQAAQQAAHRRLPRRGGRAGRAGHERPAGAAGAAQERRASSPRTSSRPRRSRSWASDPGQPTRATGPVRKDRPLPLVAVPARRVSNGAEVCPAPSCGSGPRVPVWWWSPDDEPGPDRDRSMRAYRCPRCHALLDLTASDLRPLRRAGSASRSEPGRRAPARPDAGLGPMGALHRVGWHALQLAGAPWRRGPLRVLPADAHRARRRRRRRTWSTCPASRAASVASVYQLHDLGLPIVDRAADPEHGLCFDLLSSRMGPVTIGHANGVITIDLAESDDAHRRCSRHSWTSRTGRCWATCATRSVTTTGTCWSTVAVTLEPFRQLFGDERASYQDALDRHYREGAPPGWEADRVSAYATMHPWEDWAETFAHYLHIRDTLQTAAAWGIVVGGPAGDPHPSPGSCPWTTSMTGTSRPSRTTGPASRTASTRSTVRWAMATCIRST